MSLGNQTSHSGASVMHPMHRPGAYAFKPHHRKPFRKRHIILIALMYLLSLGSGIGIGVITGQLISTNNNETINNKISSTSKVEKAGVYSFTYSQGTFEKIVSRNSQDNSVQLRPDPLVSAGKVAASRFSISSIPVSESALETFAPKTDELFEVSLESQKDEVISGVPFTKYVYIHQPQYSSSAQPVYSVVWLGSNDRDSIVIKVEGLIGSNEIPGVYEPVFASLKFSNGPDVLGLNISKIFNKTPEPSPLSQKYIADSISPSVVKIYNIVCGVIFLDGQQISQEGCQGTVGSGFFVSSDGYIATNGHVVVFEPTDAFVELLMNEPQLFAQYFRQKGLEDSQISQLSSRADLMAAVVAEFYSLPEGTIEMRNMQQTILVAHGDDPLPVVSTADFRSMANLKDSKSLKHAKIVASDYSPKDIYVVSSGDQHGFSSSDVALLKVDLQNSPFIRSYDGSIITQNQAISVLGFPADAENALIDNSEIAVTVTNGTIGSIRTAVGSSNKLFQSDADASQGSSGGPAVNSEGQVFGLLTYRFKNETMQDAAKSYIRDFSDVKQLALNNGVTFNQQGSVQENWEMGLRYYADGYYSESLKYFEAVQEDYPSHRLAPQYIAAANRAIDNGRDISPKTINYLSVGLGVGIVGMIGAGLLIVRHHGRHKLYLLHFPHMHSGA